MELNAVVVFILGLFIGFGMAWLMLKNKKTSSNLSLEKFEELKVGNINLNKDVEYLNQRIEHSLIELKNARNREIVLVNEKLELSSKLSEAKANYTNLQEKLNYQTNSIENLQERFTKEFKLVANSILRQNSEEFSKSNQKELKDILNPLKEKIQHFESSVEKKYIDETKERSTLKQEIRQLMEMNSALNDQAQNLTNALKGDNKIQGNWGEMILERILESSGLIKGDEYETQYSDTNVDNKRIQPDVVINLPDNKHIIVDSKVSLVAYEKYTNSENVDEREIVLKEHVLSVRNHVRLLSEKNYQSGIGVHSPDFVLLFIPIESSFSAAIQGDEGLYNYAWDKKVVIVSPTTLLATLRTIASVWKHERQTKNAIEIADKAGRLYDKFKSFIDDMQKIDRGINATRSAYDDAFNKLKSGTGNLIRRAETIKELGAKTSKSLPQDLILDSNES